jgi:hypothetical protein
MGVAWRQIKRLGYFSLLPVLVGHSSLFLSRSAVELTGFSCNPAI